MARLRLEDVTKTFTARAGRRAPVEALRGIDLDVANLATLAIVGPSGCGKTTLLRTIAGLDRPDRGRVLFDDRDVTDAPPSSRSVGFVFQGLALFDHLDVKANIGYGVRSRAGRAGVVLAAASRARVGAVLDESPRRLSGGERQRVALARALAIAPSVLVLDEPFASLDAPLRAELRAELARSRREFGTTTVLVTHDRADAFALGDAVAVMDAGRIVQIDAPEAILERPATSFVASFLGAPGLSLIDGRIEGVRFLAPGGLTIPLGSIAAPGPVRAGVRADAVRFDANGPVGGRIAVIERDGSGALAQIDGEFGTLAARMPIELSRTARAGDTVRLTVDAAGTHIFAPDGSRVLTA